MSWNNTITLIHVLNF